MSLAVLRRSYALPPSYHCGIQHVDRDGLTCPAFLDFGRTAHLFCQLEEGGGQGGTGRSCALYSPLGPPHSSTSSVVNTVMVETGKHRNDGSGVQEDVTDPPMEDQDTLMASVRGEVDSSDVKGSLGEENVAPASTYVTASRRESQETANPFASPLDQCADASASSPLESASEKDASPASMQVAVQVDRERRQRIRLHPFVKGVIILTVFPFIIAMGAVFCGGALLYGVGQLLAGLGDIMMGGPLRKKAKKAWQDRRVEAAAERWDVSNLV